MNVYGNIRTLQGSGPRHRRGARHDRARRRFLGRAAARCAPRRSIEQCRPGVRPRVWHEAARSRRSPGRAPRRWKRYSRFRWRGRVSSISCSTAMFGATSCATFSGQGTAYGDSDFGAGQRVNVEYVSVNPTGPMHVGHGRGAVVGDALAALLAKAGYSVTREYYVNDAGVQVDLLARSLYHRYREAAGDAPGAMPEGFLSRRLSRRDRRGAARAGRKEMAACCGEKTGCRPSATSRSRR